MDSPRSWAVAAACCWINVFTFALVRSAAVVYVALLRAFPVTREQASWPVNLSVVCYFLTGPIAGVLARYIPIWKLTVIGCLGGSLAVCVCVFAQSMIFLDIFLGVTHGTCIGLLALFSVVINQHFHKYRAMASGISNAGFTIGGLIFPPVIQSLADYYGIRGALLLVGALMLNSVAGAFLQRTTPKEQPEPPLRGDDAPSTGDTEQCPDEEDAMIKRREEFEDNSFRGNVAAVTGTEFSDAMDEPGTDGAGEANGVHFQIKSSGTKGHEVDSDEEDDDSAKLWVLVAQGSTQPKAVKNLTPGVAIKKGAPSSKNSPLLSFLLFPAFYLISFSLSVIAFNMSTYMTVIVDFAVDRGVSKWNAVYLIFAYAVADLLARLGSGWITDRKYLLKSTMMGSHFVLWGASLYVMPLCSQYYCHVSLSILSGWCNGSTLILIAVFFMELVGIDKLGVCFGIATTFTGLLGLARPPLIGLYRDAHGDYEGLFGLIGGVSLGMSLLWLCYYVQERCASHRKREPSSRTWPKLAAIFTSEEKSWS
ncbi:monocarboxylate transporter 12-like isoform X1 [Dermacentor albipictus]|uniref:monocarboxylate transporter 12-like isoform X1 n=1 Tax=Dermacentor albipictus TaxID=60249 RepID=UPI0031FC102C